MFSKHLLSLTITLKYFYEIQLEPKADELLHLWIFFLKKDSIAIMVWLEFYLTMMCSLDDFALNWMFNVRHARDL